MLNCCVVEGVVSSEVITEIDEARKVRKTTFHMKNERKPGKQSYYNKFFVIAYGNLADECAFALKEGMRVRVQGSVNTWTKNNKSGATIDANYIGWK